MPRRAKQAAEPTKVSPTATRIEFISDALVVAAIEGVDRNGKAYMQIWFDNYRQLYWCEGDVPLIS